MPEEIKPPEIPDHPPIGNWQFIVIVVMLTIGLLGGGLLLKQRNDDAASARGQREAAAVSACRVRINSQYEDKRDDIITSKDRDEFLARVAAFVEFRRGPNGERESRAERAERVCPG